MTEKSAEALKQALALLHQVIDILQPELGTQTASKTRVDWRSRVRIECARQVSAGTPPSKLVATEIAAAIGDPRDRSRPRADVKEWKDEHSQLFQQN